MSSSTEQWRQRASGAAAWTLGAVFLIAGITKLIGLQVNVEMFQAFGLPVWARYAVGVFEISSAVLLVVPATRFFGALGICAAMLGAAAIHLASGVLTPMVFANGLLLAVAFWVASQTGMKLRALPLEPAVQTPSHVARA